MLCNSFPYTSVLSAQVLVPKVRFSLTAHMMVCHLLQKHDWNRKTRSCLCFHRAEEPLSCGIMWKQCKLWQFLFFLILALQLANCMVLIWYQRNIHHGGAVSANFLLIIQIDAPARSHFYLLKSNFLTVHHLNPTIVLQAVV